MQPLDVPAQDRRLYYNDSIMLHKKHGPVHILLDDRPTYSVDLSTTERKRCSLGDLSIFWLPSGSHNYKNTAFSLSRHVARSARKSADRGSYRILWQRRGPSEIRLTSNVLLELARNQAPFYTPEEALNLLKTGGYAARAISHDIILAKSVQTPGRINIVHCGLVVGKVDEDGVHTKDREDSPLGMYIREQLK